MITRRSFGGLTFAVAPATTRYLSLEHFGASGPYARLADEFGFTPANTEHNTRMDYCLSGWELRIMGA